MASAADSARMKMLAPLGDGALIYLYRNESFGAAVHMDVRLDGTAYGQTVAKSYMVWEVKPGNHSLVSQAENDAQLTLNILPGRRYFVWQEVKMGVMFARSQLHEVPEAQGQSGVNECELIRMPLPPRPDGQPPAPPPAPTANVAHPPPPPPTS
jgi:hypothetical protein